MALGEPRRTQIEASVQRGMWVCARPIADHGLLPVLPVVVRLWEQLQIETEDFHSVLDDEAFRRVRTVDEYRRFLSSMFGFIEPIERQIHATRELAQFLDPARLRKAELLRRDLLALKLTAEQIDQLARCPIPILEDSFVALGWAYVVERSTLMNNTIYIAYAMSLPGEMLFASNYLKCYAGVVGEMWQRFGDTIGAAEQQGGASRVITAAKTAAHFLREWMKPPVAADAESMHAHALGRAPSPDVDPDPP